MSTLSNEWCSTSFPLAGELLRNLKENFQFLHWNFAAVIADPLRKNA